MKFHSRDHFTQNKINIFFSLTNSISNSIHYYSEPGINNLKLFKTYMDENGVVHDTNTIY